MAALTVALLAPFHNAPRMTAGNLALLRRDLAATASVPDDLWQRAGSFHLPVERGSSALPGPEQVDADPLGCLAQIADRTATALLGMTETGRPEWVFPPPPLGFHTNTVYLAYGTAGVVHALHRAGVPIPDDVDRRLRRDAATAAQALPPGLAVGTAGVALVLAQRGHLDEAVDLLRAADGHPLTDATSTLADTLRRPLRVMCPASRWASRRYVAGPWDRAARAARRGRALSGVRYVTRLRGSADVPVTSGGLESSCAGEIRPGDCQWLHLAFRSSSHRVPDPWRAVSMLISLQAEGGAGGLADGG
ncbi:hypothetical protein ABZX85_36495 [Streptomyces sp. NPDC004539]|uniref:hypothetical protein n=1 Tax=Streptomyces sp. NPDC004539 TaxID=3154280 RepID=UPI00339E3292